MAGKFCTPAAGAIPRAALDKAPSQGYNYNSTLLAETKILPNIAFPKATTTANSVFTFPVPAAIVGLWLASSLTNPNGDTVGVFAGKVSAGTAQLTIPNAANIFFQHISISTNTISRTGGLSFGEYSGLQMNSGEQFGCYLTGLDAAVLVTYALSIVWIQLT